MQFDKFALIGLGVEAVDLNPIYDFPDCYIGVLAFGKLRLSPTGCLSKHGDAKANT